jgi:hypothetical protein
LGFEEEEEVKRARARAVGCFESEVRKRVEAEVRSASFMRWKSRTWSWPLAIYSQVFHPTEPAKEGKVKEIRREL